MLAHLKISIGSANDLLPRVEDHEEKLSMRDFGDP
jgi:hypothetical protein